MAQELKECASKKIEIHQDAKHGSCPKKPFKDPSKVLPSFLTFLPFLTMSTYDDSEFTVCSSCKLSYDSDDWQWCRDGGVCMFCKNYTTDSTHLDILRDADMRFLFSGMTRRPMFFGKHVVYAKAWCMKHGIPNTPDSDAMESSLLRQRDWTREYWH